MKNANLTIPPSCFYKYMQLSSDDARKTSVIANVRIYVEQAIGRIKYYRIMKNEIPMSRLLLINDIV